jgi:sialate O-acetylesterase
MELRKASIVILLLSFTVWCSTAQTRIACIGNCITFGAGVENRELNCYPAQLQNMLGSKFEVRNFG